MEQNKYIDNLEKAKILFQHLLDAHDNSPEITKDLEKEINFCEKTIKDATEAQNEIFLDLKNISITYNEDTIDLTGKQEFFLLEELLHNKEIHWTMGYVFFRNWQDGIDSIPVEQFRRPASKIRTLFKGIEIIKSFKTKDKRVWKLTKNVNLKSQKEEIETILNNINENDKDLISQCQKALSLYPNSYQGNKKIIDILHKIKGKKEKYEWQDLAINVHRVIHVRADNLEKGYAELFKKGVENKWKKKDGWQEAIPYLWKMKQNLEEAKHYYSLAEELLGKAKLNKDNEKLFNLLNSIRDIHRAYQVKVPQETEKSLTENLFYNFIKDELIKCSIKNAVSSIKGWAFVNQLIKNHKDLHPLATSFLLQVILDYPKALKERTFTSTASLMQYLKVAIYNHLINWFLIEAGVPENKVADVLALMKLQKQMKQKNRMVTNDDILLEIQKEKGSSKWGKEKLYETPAYIQKLGGFQDVSTLNQKSKDHHYNEGAYTQEGYYDGIHDYD